jgi:para-nitrobenzyl esterase
MSDVLVGTSSGVVRGVEGRSGPVFRSVPYAAPPSGAGRFAAPEPAAPWAGQRDATSPGPTAPMPDRRWFGELDMGPLLRGWVPGDDHLTASVWTPSTSGRAPVLVWVHGGASLAGSGDAPAYDGSAFARGVGRRLADQLGVAHTAWVGFVTSGDPGWTGEHRFTG